MDNQERKYLTLGELQAALKTYPKDWKVVFDYNGNSPCATDSYRGYYEDLGIEDSPTSANVAFVSELVHRALGSIFCGWKGGEYLMDSDTRVWAAQAGIATNRLVVGITASEGLVTIQTELLMD